MKYQVNKANLTPGQLAFMQSVEKQVLVSGGYGSGKTTALAIKLMQLRSLNPGVPGLMVAPTYSSLKSVTLRCLQMMLKRKLPGNMVPKVKAPSGEHYLDFGDGVPIFLRSARNPETIDGLDVGWAVGDEIRYWDKHQYDIVLGRVRVDCPFPQKAFASTPAIGWMSDEFDSGKKGRQIIVAPTIENEKNLAEGFIDNLRVSYSKQMQRAVLEGLFVVLEGAVFEEFDPTVGSDWLVDYDARQFPHRKTYLAFDPGYRKSAVLWIHEIAPCDWIVYDQLMPENASDDQVVNRINARGWPIDEIWVDAAAKQVQSTSGVNTLMAMANIKKRQYQSVKMIRDMKWRSIPFGVDKLRTIMGGQDLPIRLKFATSLLEKERHQPRGIIKDMSSIRYPEVKDGYAVTDLPLKDGRTDHSTDALRYWAVGMWLSSPLRQLDAQLRQDTDPGWRFAA